MPDNRERNLCSKNPMKEFRINQDFDVPIMANQDFEIIYYKNLLDSKLQNIFKQYKIEMKKFPNRGVSITLPFMRWIKQNKDLTNKEFLLKKCTEINRDNEITEYIIDKIINSKLSQNKIAESIRDFELNISWNMVNKISTINVFNGDKVKHDKRFLRSISYDIEQQVIKILNEEAKKKKAKPLNEIWRNFNKIIPISTIQNIARKNFGINAYKKLWKSNTDLISEDTISQISKTLLYEFKKKKSRSLRSIADDFPNVSKNILVKIAKDIFNDDEFDAKWGHTISKEDKQSIIDLLNREYIKNCPMSIMTMCNLFPVSHSTIYRLGKKLFGEENFTNKWYNDDVLRSGYLGHQCINIIITEFFHYLCIKYYCELHIFHDNRRIDGLLIDVGYLHKRLFDLWDNILEIDKNMFSEIKAVVFEFTNDITFVNMINKISKYQSDEIMLFIINTGKYWEDPTNDIINDRDIIYPKNFRIINYDLFIDLIGLNKEYKKKFLNVIDYISKRDIENLKKYSLTSIKLNHKKELRKTFKTIFRGYKTLEEIKVRYNSDV